MEYTDKDTLANILNKMTDPLDLSMVRHMLEEREQAITKQETVNNLKKALQDYFDVGFTLEVSNGDPLKGYGRYYTFNTLQEFYDLVAPDGDWSEYLKDENE